MLSRDVGINVILSCDRPGTILRDLCKSARGFAPQLQALKGIQQSPEHHPEGDAFEHTCQVVDAMAVLLEGIDGCNQLFRDKMILAAITHDMGKAVTTEWNEVKGKWTAYGHEVVGVPIAQDFLISWKIPQEVFPFVLALVRWHMSHCRPAEQWTDKSVKKLINALQPHADLHCLLMLMEADCRGRGTASSGLPAAVDKLVAIAEKLPCR
jgi:tRNA nucleotidyltransferase (CCA-adding enzyme)